MLKWRAIGWVIPFCCWVAAAAGETGAADELNQRLGATTSLQGEFTQTLHDLDGTLLEESRGRFALERPGRFYWHTLKPFEQLLVSDQETIWLYDPDLEQVTVRDYDEEVQGSPAAVLSGDIDTLDENFFVEHESVEGQDHFTLTPRTNDAVFQQLELRFDGKRLVELRMRDNLDQLSTFRFTDVARNERLDPSLFEFEPPEGVDVLVD